MYRSSNIFLGLLWFCFLSLLYMVPLDILKTVFDKKVENLEKKLERMYDIVYKLTTENNELKARVKALENFAIDGNNFKTIHTNFLGSHMQIKWYLLMEPTIRKSKWYRYSWIKFHWTLKSKMGFLWKENKQVNYRRWCTYFYQSNIDYVSLRKTRHCWSIVCWSSCFFNMCCLNHKQRLQLFCTLSLIME